MDLRESSLRDEVRTGTALVCERHPGLCWVTRTRKSERRARGLVGVYCKAIPGRLKYAYI